MGKNEKDAKDIDVIDVNVNDEVDEEITKETEELKAKKKTLRQKLAAAPKWVKIALVAGGVLTAAAIAFVICKVCGGDATEAEELLADEISGTGGILAELKAELKDGDVAA